MSSSPITIQKHTRGTIINIIIDLEDLELYNSTFWNAIPQAGPEILYRLYSPKHKDYFHRIIMKAEKNDHIDHIDKNPLNNSKTNLRIVTNQQNSFNKRGHSDSKYSNFKGVSFSAVKGNKRAKPWVAQIKCGDILRHQYFHTEIEAALKYNEWAKELFGEFAHLNNINNNFKNSLEVGKSGENFFFECYNKFLIKSQDLRWDFETINNKKIEVKYDTYPSHITNNLFIETISNDKKGTLGGPFRAAKDAVDYYVYIFKDTKEIYTFNTVDLINKIKEIENTLCTRIVKNKYYNTKGYAVPKEQLLSIMIEPIEMFK